MLVIFVIDEKGKNGHVYNKREGFCLETQVEPNAVNVEAFHSPVLEAGESISLLPHINLIVRKNNYNTDIFVWFSSYTFV